jgi:microcystin degradation protein MlrC
MKILIAGMSQETNSFSVIPTSLASFRTAVLYLPEEHDAAGRQKAERGLESVAGLGDFLVLCREAGQEAVVGPVGIANTAGPLSRDCYETLRDAILDHARAAGPVDAVLLQLHGAQIAHGYVDCEGDLLARLRAVVGAEVPIGALLDLHGSISPEMLASATVLMACKEYPHFDYPERAAELFEIIVAAAEGRVTPVTSLVRVPMLAGIFTTTEPGKSFVDGVKAREGRDGILTISPMHGFSAADTPHNSAAVLVVTDDARQAGDAVAREVAREFFTLRSVIRSSYRSIAECIDEALAEPEGPVIIAEPADNPGAGMAGDATFVLRELIARDVQDAAAAFFWDPIAVQFCFDAGLGAVLPLRIGAKTGPNSGEPLDVVAEVIGLKEDARVSTIFARAGHRMPFGPAAAIRVGGVEIVLNTIRAQPYAPDAFTELGIDPLAKKIITLKSSQHFNKLFAPIAKKVLYCNTPASRTGFMPQMYRHLPRPVWPHDDIEFDGETVRPAVPAPALEPVAK